MDRRIPTLKIFRKAQSPNVHGQHPMFAKNEKELETLIQAMRIYSQDIRMEFGIEKCTMSIMRSGKQHTTERIEPPNKEKVKTIGKKETYKYFVILEVDTIKEVEIKKKKEKRKKKEYFSRTRKLLETKLYSRSHIKGINTCTVHVVRYAGPFLKWTKKELQQMNQRIRKLKTEMISTDDMYQEKKEWRGCTSTEDNINDHRGKLFIATRNSTDSTSINRTTITRK